MGIIIYVFTLCISLNSLFPEKLQKIDNECTPASTGAAKIFYLNEIFGESIQFNDLCRQGIISTYGSQTVSQKGSASYYFNYERIYYNKGNEISIAFYFNDSKSRLYQNIWEKYLMNNSLNVSDNMFFIVKVIYNGEEYVNAKRTGLFPLNYNLLSDVEMNKINYDIVKPDSCSMMHILLMKTEINLTGLIYNEWGTRAIDLGETRLKFQIGLIDTTQIIIHHDGYRITPKPQNVNPREDFINYCLEKQNVWQGEKFDMPCIFWKGKPFVCQNKSHMVFKLPEKEYQEALAMEGTLYFNPKGDEKPLAQWIQIPYYYRKQWASYADIAFDYISQ